MGNQLVPSMCKEMMRIPGFGMETLTKFENGALTPNSRANVVTNDEILGKVWARFCKISDGRQAWFCGTLRPPEKAGNFSGPVVPWVVQRAGSRQDLQTLKPLEETLLVCLLRQP